MSDFQENRMHREFPFPIPNGWFTVAYSDELEKGQVKPLRYFAKDLVLFRAESGQASMLDAFCPHLGAHLGYGGKVEGDTLRCPFHAWRFDCSGSCVDVPYAKKIPPKASLRAWPLIEQNGLIMAWYHAEGKPPGWAIPKVPEFDSDEWTPPERREWVVRSRNQELAENTVDQAHFRYLHGTETVAETEFGTDGHILHVISRSRMGTAQGSANGMIDIQAHGFGFGMTRFHGIVDTLVVTSGSPIDEEYVHMRLNLSVRKLPNSDATRGVGKAFIEEIERQFAQDIPIWEHKAFFERPVLCDGDGPIGMLRKWARQFYSEAPVEGARS